MDETPLQHVPKFAGAYSNKKRVVVAGSYDKRQQTACPVLTQSGKVLLTQVIIRGKCKRCLEQGDAIDRNFVQMYAEKKTQTGATFIARLHQIESRLNINILCPDPCVPVCPFGLCQVPLGLWKAALGLCKAVMGLWKAVHFGRLSVSPLDGTVPLLMYCLFCTCTQGSEDQFFHTEWTHCFFFL